MIRTQKWLLAIATSLIVILAACGSDSDSDSEESGSEAGAGESDGSGDSEEGSGESEDGIRIAIVAPSAENDLAFTQSIIEGADALSGVSEIAVTPGTFVVEDAATAIRDYADDGYDLILAHGSQYGGPLQEIAGDFPDTAFAWGTAEDTFGLDNVSSYTANSDQGGYVLGALAAGMCSKIGVVGPIEVGDAKLYVDGFKLGAEAGGAEVDVVYIESFSDVQLAADTAAAFVQNGADCLTGTAQMTVGAIGVAEQEGLLWFGTQSDQTPAAADGVVVANQIYEWEVVLQGLVDDVTNGSLGGNIYGIDLENGGLVVEFGNVETTDEMTQLVSDTADEVKAKEVTTTVDG